MLEGSTEIILLSICSWRALGQDTEVLTLAALRDRRGKKNNNPETLFQADSKGFY